MAALYGGRWRVLDQIGRGGQSVVFKVMDEFSDDKKQFALKRILNPRRRNRFEREVQAIRQLRHQNIIQLIDNSALESSTNEDEKMFIVMQIAEKGDLSQRAEVYKLSLDSTLQVAKQLCSALSHAHEKGIIHRDVKPANILFPDAGHTCWLSDFGICLIREQERFTSDKEPVGPWSFMAPELEGGGQLDVSNAADVYSLGKVIYFMISGGIVLPRERLDDSQYVSVFEGGERYRLLRILLGKMICSLDVRLKSMKEVETELLNIDIWESKASVAPLSSAARAAVDRLKKEEIASNSIKEQNAIARQNEEATLNNVAESYTDWLRLKLENTCTTIQVPDILHCRTNDFTDPNILRFKLGQSQFYVAIAGIELLLEKPQEVFKRVHGLSLLLCRHRKIRISVGKQVQSPPNDLQLVFFPYYVQHAENRSGDNLWQGFINRRSKVRIPQRSASWVTRTFIGGDFTIFYSFRVSQWPAIRDQIEAELTEAVEVFIDYIANGADRIG